MKGTSMFFAVLLIFISLLSILGSIGTYIFPPGYSINFIRFIFGGILFLIISQAWLITPGILMYSWIFDANPNLLEGRKFMRMILKVVYAAIFSCIITAVIHSDSSIEEMVSYKMPLYFLTSISIICIYEGYLKRKLNFK